LNQVVRWINGQEQNIKLQIKVNLDKRSINQEDVIKFLNSNRIIELKVSQLTQEIPQIACQQLRLLELYDCSKVLHLEKFKHL
jgi:hypothetical protein